MMGSIMSGTPHSTRNGKQLGQQAQLFVVVSHSTVVYLFKASSRVAKHDLSPSLWHCSCFQNFLGELYAHFAHLCSEGSIFYNAKNMVLRWLGYELRLKLVLRC
ncbi:hypothetical protein BS50DRAFT_21931 [Corynespora cassiicola Philippines]|uniref:Uncharacterized protein n=1 Tax=Corynespora cassiicola Philippines TaxID=1448308 RepID=A0A2T2PAM0_CORCC|nr:hypothetical protein BS50DRAFT_21931 [Corynespora cassiicola Philippines]